MSHFFNLFSPQSGDRARIAILENSASLTNPQVSIRKPTLESGCLASLWVTKQTDLPKS